MEVLFLSNLIELISFKLPEREATLKGIKAFNIELFQLDERKLSVLVQAFFSAWMLAFLFEGQIIYSFSTLYRFDPTLLVAGNLVAHYVGMVSCGLFIKTKRAAKRLLIISYLIAIVVSILFFFKPSVAWLIGSIVASLFAGASLAAWGFFLKSGTPKNKRLITVADLLIISNLLMIGLSLAAVYISPQTGLLISMVLLMLAVLFALNLPDGESNIEKEKQEKEQYNIRSLIFFLGFFIFVITIVSGLMYQVVKPAFRHLEWISSWYWAIPYIIAIILVTKLPKRVDRTYLLFVAISMIATAFVSFLALGRDLTSYLIINTLMMGACGIFDLFWWSILGEMIDLHRNPATVFGVGLSANILGILVGGVVANLVGSGLLNLPEPALLALILLSVSLVLLPPLNKHLVGLLKHHTYLSSFSELSEKEQAVEIDRTATYGQLSDREMQVVSLILKGKTNKEIAADLYITENTVKYYVKSIYEKFNVHNRTELLTLLYEERIKTSQSH